MDINNIFAECGFIGLNEVTTLGHMDDELFGNITHYEENDHKSFSWFGEIEVDGAFLSDDDTDTKYLELDIETDKAGTISNAQRSVYSNFIKNTKSIDKKLLAFIRKYLSEHRNEWIKYHKGFEKFDFATARPDYIYTLVNPNTVCVAKNGEVALKCHYMATGNNDYYIIILPMIKVK